MICILIPISVDLQKKILFNQLILLRDLVLPRFVFTNLFARY